MSRCQIATASLRATPATAWLWFLFSAKPDKRECGEWRTSVQKSGAHTANIAGFGGYLNQGAVDVGQAYSQPLHLLPRFRHTPPSDRTALIDWGHYRFTWCFWSEFYLLRVPSSRVTPAEVAVPAGQFHPTPFPLNDAEGANLIEDLSARSR